MFIPWLILTAWPLFDPSVGSTLLAQDHVAMVNAPVGFRVDVFAENLSSPRRMAFGPDGWLYVTESGTGRVLRLSDVDGDGRADTIASVLEGLDRPAGIAWHAGDLWVAESVRVIRVAVPLDSGPRFDITVVVDSLPDSGHSRHALLIDPAGRGFFLSIGSSCNLCIEDDGRRAKILRYNMDGSGEQVWASGLQNASSLAINPLSGELWATEPGRNWLGDDLPPDELNVIRRGGHYGWPYCYGARVPNPEYANQSRCDTTEPPILTFQAHSSPLGVTFYDGEMFPADYRGDVFVALHGSWNRSVQVGYKVVRLKVEAGRPVAVSDFLTGWVGEGRWVLGRPVQPLVGPDGALYVSDDYGGRIWRVVYEGG
jgi:glucose/arabinose dehydrogenase